MKKQDEADPVSHYARAMWLSPRDCRNAMRCAVEADIPEKHITVNVCSRNTESYLSLVETRRLLNYTPKDDSIETLRRQ
jgi:L-arabinose 1-dehydrogenase [NAD(P)+]